MAAIEPICFAKPAQLGGSSSGVAAHYLNLSPLWRYVRLFAATRLASHSREARA